MNRMESNGPTGTFIDGQYLESIILLYKYNN